MSEQKLKHIQTSTHAHTAEIFIQTFRMNLQRRFAAKREFKSDCVKHIDDIVNHHKHTTNSTIEIKPVDAVKPANHLWVSWHLLLHAKRCREYPKISKFAYVRIKINQKKTAKGHDPTFTSTRHKVAAIKDGEYFIPSYQNIDFGINTSS